MCYLSKIHLKELNFKHHSTHPTNYYILFTEYNHFLFHAELFFFYLSFFFFSDILNSDIFSHTKMKKIEKYELIIMICNYLKW
jgi:hypothetical protein